MFIFMLFWTVYSPKALSEIDLEVVLKLVLIVAHPIRIFSHTNVYVGNFHSDDISHQPKVGGSCGWKAVNR